MAVYSRDLMVYYFYELLEGNDAGTAYDSAVVRIKKTIPLLLKLMMNILLVNIHIHTRI